MAEFIKNRPFRFWCQKVLPLVYDDSLSYYELLCKVVCKLNELAENQNNLSDEIKQVAADLDDFKNQVPGMIEAKVQEWLDNYIATHGLVNSVNGMTGNVVLKKLTASTGGGLSISGEDGYNGSQEQTIEIADGGVTTEKIADNAITAQKIANDAVTADKIADNAITAQKIANDAVTADKIADGAITSDKMASGAIPTKLPNPNKLTFTGGATGTYDGSEPLSVNVPQDAYYTNITATDNVGTKWTARLSVISNTFGVLDIRTSETVKTGPHKLTISVATGIPNGAYGAAAAVSTSSSGILGAATVIVGISEINVILYLSTQSSSTAATIPFVRNR